MHTIQLNLYIWIYLGHVIGSLMEKRLNALISLLGCLLFLASGALVIDEWHDTFEWMNEHKRKAMAAGALMIINGAVFLLDTLCICNT